MSTVDPATAKRIIELKNRIVDAFDHSHWVELGLLIGYTQEIESHPRLLRSLAWQDSDYPSNVLEVLRNIVASDPGSLDTIEQFVQSKFGKVGEFISSSSGMGRQIVFSPSVFTVPEEPVDINLLSVMMPFGVGFDNVYNTIRRAAVMVGFTCYRADDIWEHSTVMDDIFSLIFRSHIVVCDLTGKNANVFYEIGIAHTLGKEVIPITQSEEDVPFDLQHHRYIRYLNNSQGMGELGEKLIDRLKTLKERRV